MANLSVLIGHKVFPGQHVVEEEAVLHQENGDGCKREKQPEEIRLLILEALFECTLISRLKEKDELSLGRGGTEPAESIGNGRDRRHASRRIAIWNKMANMNTSKAEVI